MHICSTAAYYDGARGSKYLQYDTRICEYKPSSLVGRLLYHQCWPTAINEVVCMCLHD